MQSLLRSGAILALVAGLGACAPQPEDIVADAVPVTKAALPTTIRHEPRIEATLACIRRTGILSDRTFVVGSFADSTGKINAVAAGSTGNFVPQGGSASYITDALKKAGGRVISTYFGAPKVPLPAHYAINGIFNSLDFGAPVSADVRVAGIGPTLGAGWAQLTLSIQLDAASTRVNHQMSMIQRPVKYKQIGVGVGRVFPGSSTLVTGNVSFQNQERLQFEALNGPIALGVADVLMKEFPKATGRCRRNVADLLRTDA